LEQLGQKSPKRFNDIAMAMGAVGAGLIGIAAYAAKTAADFDRQMSHVGAVADATAGQLGQLRAAAMAAGQATQFSATDAARAEEELAKAGISTANILGGALNGSLALAAAGSLDLAEAADVAAKAMNIFHLQGKDVGHIADVLASGANKSATDVHEIGEALKMGGLAAASAGWSLEQTTGVLSAFADRGLAGSDAGTSLKTAIMMLQKPTEKAADLMRELGIKVYDASGNFVGAADLAGQLQEKLGTLSKEQRNAAIATIFGADAMRGANVLYDLGADGVRRYVQEVNDAGAAQRTAAANTDNLAGDLERLHGTLETLAIDAGSGANGGLRTLVQALDGLARNFSVLPGPIQTTGVVLAGLTGITLLGAAGWMKLREKVVEVQTALAATGPIGTRASAALGGVTAFAGRLAVTLGALQVASALLAKDISPNMQQLNNDLVNFGQSGQAAGQAAVLFGKDLSLLKYDIGTMGSGFWAKAGNGIAGFVEGISGLGNVFDESLVHARARMGELDQALSQMVASGHGDDAAKVFERLRAEADKQGVSLGDLKAALPTYTAAIDGATVSEQRATQAAAQHTLQNNLLSGSLREAVDAAGGLKALFDQLNGAQLNVNETTIAAEAAVDDLTESFQKNGHSLDVTTAAGRANVSALDELAQKAAEAAEAVYQQTGSVDQASATFEGYRQQMVNTLVAMGRTRAEAEALANQLMAMPKNIPINVVVTTTYRQNGTQSMGNSRNPGINSAHGGTIDYYAGGGMNDGPHVAQVAPAGSWRVWGEPETGGEGYIPLSAAKRNGAIATMAAINRRFGDPLGGGGGSSGPLAVSLAITGAGQFGRLLAATLQDMQRNGQLQLTAD
jgi:TP901 family phage tail tape measure protein